MSSDPKNKPRPTPFQKGEDRRDGNVQQPPRKPPKAPPPTKPPPKK